ncbi:hypothetical protein C8J57DRAFT_1502922 [Mycena rebaudengoi]|nr:hypothetical protein C8J57DRAFT_1502922 [Mycena rebaudengoi]
MEGGKEKGNQGLNQENEIARMIAFLVVTDSEDWTMVLDVCFRVSASDSSARAAMHTLGRELKHGVSAAQLAAARLWGILIRNSPNAFGSQAFGDFLDTLEELISSFPTSIVVRERIMLVLAAAAYADGSTRDNDFRSLWRRVRPFNKPENGIPLADDDVIFKPTIRHMHDYENSTSSIIPTVQSDGGLLTDHSKISKDMHQIFHECKIGSGNAELLSSALIVAAPEDLNNAVIKEFYTKCRESQQNILLQIPWAVEATRSRVAKEDTGNEHDQMHETSTSKLNTSTPHFESPMSTLTCEEQVLADLLATSTEILEALQMYDDLERVGSEREAENRGRKATPTHKPLPTLPSLSVAGPSRPRYILPPETNHF